MSLSLDGQLISGRYRILSPLGEGAMGAVYLAEDVTLKRQVALKVLRKEWAARPEIHKRLENECRILAKLGSHCNIVTLFDRIVHEGNVILVMEYVPSETVADLLNRTRRTTAHGRTGTPVGPTAPLGVNVQSAATVPLASPEPASGSAAALATVPLADGGATVPVLNQSEALVIAQQCLDALDFAHSRGILHRDIKPSNILITHDHNRNLVAKVMDFGIGKALLESGEGEDVTALTRADGPGPGTPAYMAPEQIDVARFGPVGPGADLYALGITLYEMLTLTIPFEGTYTELLNAHTNQKPPDPCQRNPRISPELQRILMRALEKKPRDRYPSAADFRMDLQAVGSGTVFLSPGARPAAAAPPREGGTFGKLFVLAAGIVLMLAVLLGGAFGLYHLLRSEKKDAVTPSAPGPQESSDAASVSSSAPVSGPSGGEKAALGELQLQEIPDKEVVEGNTLEFKIEVQGANPKDLTFTANDMPAGASFDPAAQTFTWRTIAANVGNYRPTFTATDNANPARTGSTAANIAVKELPKVVIDPIGGQQAFEDQPLTFSVTATGPTGGPLSFAMVGDAPRGAAFDAATQSFNWTPPAKSAGQYHVTFTATDNSTPTPLTDSRTVLITVAAAPSPPAPDQSQTKPPNQTPSTPIAAQPQGPPPAPKPKPAVPPDVKDQRAAADSARASAAGRFENTASDYRKNTDYQEGAQLFEDARKAEAKGDFSAAKSKYEQAQERFRQAKPGAFTIE